MQLLVKAYSSCGLSPVLINGVNKLWSTFKFLLLLMLISPFAPLSQESQIVPKLCSILDRSIPIPMAMGP
jgi:hypothetical protein